MKYVPTAVSRLAGRTILRTKAQSPTILFVAGVVGVGATVVTACHATLKLDRMIGDMQKEKYLLEERAAQQNEETHRKDMVFFYGRTAGEIAKLYAVPAALGVVSIGCLTGAHNILSKRNLALTAAYAGIEQTFNEYRKRVAEKYGDEEDLSFRYGSVDVVEAKVNKKGETTEVVTRQVAKTLVNPMYARFFDETCPSWNRRQDYNMAFLETQQTYWNQRLYANGHVFLNEVYDSLGFERTKAGQVMGWVLTKDGTTDSHVDFGLYDDRESSRRFVNGHEAAILLDFNVTNVYDRL